VELDTGPGFAATGDEALAPTGTDGPGPSAADDFRAVAPAVMSFGHGRRR